MKEHLVPLDIDDIRATDEFRSYESRTIWTVTEWSDMHIILSDPNEICMGFDYLATNYLRRQHGSSEWKPCTKEALRDEGVIQPSRNAC